MWGFELPRVYSFFDFLITTKQKGVNFQCSPPFLFSFLWELCEKICVCYDEKWWLPAELNHRHKDFQSSALPTELGSHHLSQ